MLLPSDRMTRRLPDTPAGVLEMASRDMRAPTDLPALFYEIRATLESLPLAAREPLGWDSYRPLSDNVDELLDALPSENIQIVFGGSDKEDTPAFIYGDPAQPVQSILLYFGAYPVTESTPDHPDLTVLQVRRNASSGFGGGNWRVEEVPLLVRRALSDPFVDRVVARHIMDDEEQDTPNPKATDD